MLAIGIWTGGSELFTLSRTVKAGMTHEEIEAFLKKENDGETPEEIMLVKHDKVQDVWNP